MNLEFQSFCNLESFKATPSKGHKRLNTAIKALAVLAIISGSYFLGASTASEKEQVPNATHDAGVKGVLFKVYIATGSSSGDVWSFKTKKVLDAQDIIQLRIFENWKNRKLQAQYNSIEGRSTSYYKYFRVSYAPDVYALNKARRKKMGRTLRVCYRGPHMPLCTEQHKKNTCWTVPLEMLTESLATDK